MTTPDLYDPNVPEFPSDSLKTSQPQFLTNFSQLFEIFAKNHVPINSVPNAGKHTIVQLFEQLSSPQTDSGEITVYTKNIEGQTDQVFIRFQGNGTEVQFTNYQIYSVDDLNFFTFLPGGIILYFGSLPNPNAPGNPTPLPVTEFIIDLVPPIAKVIASISFCPMTVQNLIVNKSQTSLLPAQNGYFSRISVRNAVAGLNVIPSYYIVVGII